MFTGIVILILLFFGLAYLFYGRFLEKKYLIKEDEIVPSKKFFDGIDFLPTHKIILLGHHFSSIAGAGPIVGPIIAGMAFGWGPAILWIVLGTIFIGGVHDFSALIASVRHEGKSIGEIAKKYMGKRVYKIFLLFIWFSLVYVITVFTDLSATSFAKEPPVAQINILYIFTAIFLGYTLYKLKIRLPFATLLALIIIGIGIIFSLNKSLIILSRENWIYILLLYCFIASVLPVWILLQPRDYLSSYLLYSVVVIGIIGIFLGNYPISYPIYISFNTELGPLFPFLFITVACGAVSGFHSLVSSGTTSKQLDNIKNAKFVAYGGMILEGVVAIISLSTVIIFSRQYLQSVKLPLEVFSNGMSKFFSTLGLNPKIGLIWGYLTVSAFILTTLDTATRVTRYVFQEILEIKVITLKVRIVATIFSLILPLILLNLRFYGPDGTPIPAWKKVWPLFGTTNQLLAALVLLTIYVWVKKSNFKEISFLFFPTLLMLILTLSALIYIIFNNPKLDLITFIDLILLFLATYMLLEGFKVFRKRGKITI